jgi:Acetyltransferases, including N-acetylases of ribosomal proteins
VFENFETLKYKLSTISLADLEGINILRSNLEIANVEGRLIDTTLEETRCYILKILTGIAAREWFYWVIKNKNNKIIGFVSIWNLKKNQGEYAFSILPKYQHCGVMSEVLPIIEKYAFEVLCLKKIFIYTKESNLKANAFALKMGYLKSGEIIENDLKGETVKMNIYYKGSFVA